MRQTAIHVPECLPPVAPAPHPGRYHELGGPWPAYAALDEATLWAEWAHATGGAVAAAEDPRWVCDLDVDLRVLDLRSRGTRHALSVSEEELVAPWSPGSPNRACLKVAAAAEALGLDGFVVPSAARPGGWNLAILPRAFDRTHVVRRRTRTPQPSGSGD